MEIDNCKTLPDSENSFDKSLVLCAEGNGSAICKVKHQISEHFLNDLPCALERVVMRQFFPKPWAGCFLLPFYVQKWHKKFEKKSSTFS